MTPRLHQTFSQKEISLRLRQPHNGQLSLHGRCLRILTSGLFLQPDVSEDLVLFISAENVDLLWIDEKGARR